MIKLRFLPLLFVVALLGLIASGAVMPTPAPVHAEEGEGDDADDDDAGEFYEEETTFSGKQVTKAIDKGVAWLRKKQGRNGSWGGMKGNATYGGGQGGNEQYQAGPTALAVFTLLKCKQPLKDPVVKKGFDYLWKHHKKPASAYEVSMLLLACTATADASKMSRTLKKKKAKPKLTGRYRQWAGKLVDQLVDMRTARGWRYNYAGQQAAPGGPEDLSSTQLAALALFAAHRMGIKVKKKVWEDILSFSLDQQEDDGPEVTYIDPVDPKNKRTARSRGFAYIKGQEHPDEGQATGGMTACGLANVEMARFIISEGGKKRDEWNKRPDAAKVQTAIFDGIAWLEKNWSPFENPGKRQMNIYHVYWLYALERAMDLLDLRRVGSHFWYNEMGQELLNRQASDGHWDTKTTLTPTDTCDTCFALLFLKRATKGSIPFGSVTGGSEEAPADNR
ncbi:MAG: hypothetical protein QNJ90_05275 [Planctomycetota bacterium]|nr:hypothetical protein [Planctomycetota bacterium]